MKNFKKSTFAVLVIAMLGVSSCSSFSPDEISEKVILKQVNQRLEDLAINKEYVPITIGTYECNFDNERLGMRKLAKAGLIDYKVTRYAWWEKSVKNVRESYKVKRSGYFYSYYDTEYRTVKKNVYDFEDHYIVDVQLKKAGKRIMKNELPQPKEVVDKDMIQPEINMDKYDWYNIELETWEEIKNPFIEEASVAENQQETVNANIEIEDDNSVEENQQENLNSEEPQVERKDVIQYKKYKELNLKSQVVYIETYSLRAIKARNIQILKNSKGQCKAVAEVILKVCDVTDAGRIFFEMENGIKRVEDVVLTYYNDRGWVLEEDSDFE